MVRFTVIALAVLLARTPPHLELRVERLLASGDTTAVIELLEHSDLESRPSPDMMVTLGKLYRGRGTIVDRLKSQKVLERAKALYPEDPDVMLELGLTYFAQTFYPDAYRHFSECLELDPDNCEAMYRMGVSEYEHWKLRVHAWLDDAEDACEWLSAAVACDSTNVDAARRLTGVLYGTGRVERARELAEALARRFPDEWYFPAVVATASFEQGDMERADSAFTHGLGLMDGPEYAAFTAIGRNTLGYEALDVYDALPEREQDAMTRGFWINSDPDPTTNLNERALEHMARTFRAEVLYSASKPHIAWTRPQTRGWDTERGETLIKFGEPDTVIASQSYWRWEKWTYRQGEEDPVTYVFFDEFMNGKYQIPRKSADLSFIRFADRATSYEPGWVELDGAMDLTVFRDDNFRATLFASIDVKASNLEAFRSGDAFASRLRLFREGWESELTAEQALHREDLSAMESSGDTYYGYIQRCAMPFDSYQVAAAFEDSSRRVHALFRSRASTYRFTNSGVQLSDILLERESAAGPTIERGEFALRPNPWCAYAPGQLLRTYVEIYDLAMRGGATSYVLHYSIQESSSEPRTAWNRVGKVLKTLALQDDGPPIVTQSMQRSGDSHTDSEPLAIDVDALPPGRYRITIGVEDLIGGNSAEVSKVFYKVGTSLAEER
jgi:GWxTD domain-containing protein